MRYRMHGEETWREGEVENISASGLLFRAEKEALKGSRIDVSIDLSNNKDAPRRIRIVAAGVILRCSCAERPEGGVVLAATLSKPHLLRR